MLKGHCSHNGTVSAPINLVKKKKRGGGSYSSDTLHEVWMQDSCMK